MDIPGFSWLNIEEEDTPKGEQKCIKKYDITEKDGKTYVFIQKDENGKTALTKDQVKEQINKIKNEFLYEVNDVNYMKGLTLDETIFLNHDKRCYDLCWDFNIKLNTESLTDSDMANIKEVLVKNMNSDGLVTIDKIFKDNAIKIRFKSHFELAYGGELPKDLHSISINGAVCSLIPGSTGISNSEYTDSMYLDTSSFDYQALQQVTHLTTTEDEDGDVEYDISSNANNKAIDFYVKDYKNPANMPFVPFLENVPVAAMSSNTSNTFTEISLKAIEGCGPQFLGGQDTTIEIQIITDDIVAVSMLNNLPIMASATAKKYRRILPA